MFQKVMDGIWPMYISQDMRICVCQYARGDWRVSEYAGRFGSRKLGEYNFSTKQAAMEKAKTLAA